MGGHSCELEATPVLCGERVAEANPSAQSVPMNLARRDLGQGRSVCFFLLQYVSCCARLKIPYGLEQVMGPDENPQGRLPMVQKLGLLFPRPVDDVWA